jgi:hypothetical protein
MTKNALEAIAFDLIKEYFTFKVQPVPESIYCDYIITVKPPHLSPLLSSQYKQFSCAMRTEIGSNRKRATIRKTLVRQMTVKLMNLMLEA